MSTGVTLDDLSRGHHTMFAYSSAREASEMLEYFLADGFQRNERIVYVAGRDTLQEVQRYGHRVADAVTKGHMLLEDWASTYMAGGTFDGERMRRHYRATVERAIAERYAGVRIAADMSWAAATDVIAPLAEYEQTLDDVLQDQPAIVVCEYDRRIFEAAELRALRDAHRSMLDGKTLHRSHRLSIERTYDPAGITFAGELDIAGREALEAALQGLPRSPVIDLCRVTYIDAGSIAFIARAAKRSLGEVTLRVSPPIAPLFRLIAATLPRGIVLHEETR